MIEFVGLSPNLENHVRGCMETMRFHVAHTKCFLKENFVSHSEGPIQQFGMNFNGPRSAG